MIESPGSDEVTVHQSPVLEEVGVDQFPGSTDVGVNVSSPQKMSKKTSVWKRFK